MLLLCVLLPFNSLRLNIVPPPSPHLPPPAQDLVPPGLPIISVSKGIEVASGQLMSEVIPSVLGKKQPTVYLSGARTGC